MAPRTTITTDAIAEVVAVRAILIDPAGDEKIVVSFVHLPTRPAHPLQQGYGLQLDARAVAELLGSRLVELHRLAAGEALLVSPSGDSAAWWLGSSGPHRGRGLVLQYERVADAISDTLFGLEEVGTLLAIDDEGEAREEEEAYGAVA